MLCNIDAPPIYPCVYREHGMLRPQFNNPTGLSLCVQGTPHPNTYPLNRCRFIPVCTGNIVRSFASPVVLSVYPCVYREHLHGQHNPLVLNGLSLCVQGTYRQQQQIKIMKRFIPVCTGNIPIITYCFIIKILTTKFPPIF